MRLNYEADRPFTVLGNLKYLTTINYGQVVVTARERMARGLLHPRLNIYP